MSSQCTCYDSEFLCDSCTKDRKIILLQEDLESALKKINALEADQMSPEGYPKGMIQLAIDAKAKLDAMRKEIEEAEKTLKNVRKMLAKLAKKRNK